MSGHHTRVIAAVLVGALSSTLLLSSCSSASQAANFNSGNPNAGTPGGVTAGAPTAPKNATESGWKVERVVDGDTIVVRRGGADERVRFAGVDTPETVKANTPVQCYGPEASRATHGLLDNQPVLLESDPTQPTYDQYGRRLAHVWTVDAEGTQKMLVSWYLVRNGFAHARTYGSPTSWTSEYNAAQKTARGEGLGFWNSATCDGNTKQAS
jgi:micrococcal nuclease